MTISKALYYIAFLIYVDMKNIIRIQRHALAVVTYHLGTVIFATRDNI